LPIDDGDAQFFLLRRVKQHAFHETAPERLRPSSSGESASVTGNVTRAKREGGRATLFCVLSQSTLERDFWRENCRKQALAPEWGSRAVGLIAKQLRGVGCVARRVARMNGGAAAARLKIDAPNRPALLRKA
jgi:hypothetical protein